MTGAGSGIGLATALRFARGGDRVVVADRDDERVRDAVDAARATGGADAMGVVCDVADEADVTRTVDAAIARFGRLDVVVNNAGMMIFKPIEDHDEDDLVRIFRVNYFGAFWFTKQVFVKCVRGAAIVNVCSVHAVQTTRLVSAYAASKAALLSLTRSAAIEGKPKGIRVNAVIPGAIDTPMLRQNPNVRSGAEVFDEGDIGQPETVAAAIEFLASADAAFITGTDLRVDGGRLARL